MYFILMMLTVLQYGAGEVQVNDSFSNAPKSHLLQAKENGHPVPICETTEKCVCPEGYALQQKEDSVSNAALVLTCEPLPGTENKTRAQDTDYKELPKPSTYGK